MSYILYVVGATIAALWLSFRTDRKILSFILIFWLFTQPVLNTALKISFSWLPFDLQPNRLLLFALTPYLFFAGMIGGTKVQAVAAKRPPFEKFMYLYLVLVILSLALNFDAIRKQHVLAVPAEIITFIIVYFTTKKYMTQSVFDAVLRAIVYLGVIAAFVSIYQIAINPEFLKTCDPRLAFGSVIRASAMFQAEYELGYFQILAIMVTMVRYKGSWLRYFLAPLLTFSLLLTFHRLDLLIFLVCLAIYLMIFGKTASKIGAVVGIVFAAALLTSVFVFTEDTSSKNGGIEARLKEDTVTGRIAQYGVVLRALPTYPFGIGDYENKSYFNLMAKHNMLYTVNPGTNRWEQHPYRVHDGFLETGLLHGILSMIVFIVLLVSLLRYFKKRIIAEFRYSIIPFYAVVIWTLANISNGISFFGVYFVILVGMLSGAFVSLYQSGSAKSMQQAPSVKSQNSLPSRQFAVNHATKSR
jgi:hypothetical protein